MLLYLISSALGIIGVFFAASIKPTSLKHLQVLMWILCGISFVLCIIILVLLKKMDNA